MKIKGGELKLWMDEDWPGDEYYWDHDLFDDAPDPAENYDTDDLGALLYQGRDEDPTGGDGLALDKLIRRWRKTTGKTVFTVAVPKEKEAEFKAYIKSLGGSTL